MSNAILRTTLNSTVNIIDDAEVKANILKLITTLFAEKLNKIQLSPPSDNTIHVTLGFAASYSLNKVRIPKEVTFTLNTIGELQFKVSYQAPHMNYHKDGVTFEERWVLVISTGKEFLQFTQLYIVFNGNPFCAKPVELAGEFQVSDFISKL